MRIRPALLAAAFLLAPGLALAQTAGGPGASPNRAPRPTGDAPRPPMRQFQPLGSFPTNTVTNRPFLSPQGGAEGYRATVGALQRTLTELQQLQLQIKQAHWNVSGTLWYPLHLLLQEHYESIAGFADRVAERLLAVGASANGRARTIVETSMISEFPGGFVDDAQVVVWFINHYLTVGGMVRQAVRDTDEPDPTTSNLLQEVDQAIAKFQWQMRAHYQATPTDPNNGQDLNAGRPVDLPNQKPADQPPAAPQPAR